LDVLLLSSRSIGSATARPGPHLLPLGFGLEVANKGAIGGRNSVIYTLYLFIEHVLKVLVGFGLGHESKDVLSVLIKHGCELWTQDIWLVLVHTENNAQDGVTILQFLHIL
jgi:hypothetical protein